MTMPNPSRQSRTGDPSPLEYRAVSRDRPRVWISLPAGGAVGVPTLVLLLICFLAAPRMEQLFADFKTELPPITMLALAVARWVRNDWGWLLLLPLPIGVSIVVPNFRGCSVAAQSDVTDEPSRRRLFSAPLLAILFSIFVIALFATAFLVPMTRLIDRLSAPAAN